MVMYQQTVFMIKHLLIIIHFIHLDESINLKNLMPEKIELNRRGVWSRLFRDEINLPQKINSRSHDFPVEPVLALKNGRIQFIPHDKRKIPLELRKALYAHGIVGRRR
jgi:hypothetical protein